MGLANFLHANTYSGKVKVTWDSIICCISRMNEWIELIFWILIGVRKAKCYFGYAHDQIWLRPFRSWGSKIFFISRINWWTIAHCHYSANEMQDKHKNKLMRERFSCFVDYKITFHFFVRNTLIKATPAWYLIHEQQFLVLKGVKRKISIINGSLAESRALLLPSP